MADLGEGTVFAGHRIDGVAGRGGMGTVYRATHLALDHMVALKVIAADLADDDSFRERFKSESRIAVSLRHPNVVPIHHAGEEDGLLFVTMDLIDGPDLRKLLLARGPLDPEAATVILEQIASALDVAHSRGLVHRDIKPGNILIEDRAGRDHAYLTDFGLTKRIDQASEGTALTSTGAFVGTLDYVAPEQIRGEDLDARSDVYALGCVFFEMLTGRAPFADREEKVAKMYAHLQDESQPLDGERTVFNPQLDRALAKQREDRFPSAGDLARAAAAALGGDRVVEAERSVATGPAAPTEIHDTIADSAPAEPAPTVESSQARPAPTTAAATPAPAEGITAESEPGPTATETEAGPEEPALTKAGAPAGARRERRNPLPAVAALLVVAALVGVAALLLGGDEEGGGGSEPGGAGASDGGIGTVSDRVRLGGFPFGASFDRPAGTLKVSAREGGLATIEPGESEPASVLSLGELGRADLEDVVVADGNSWVAVPSANEVLRIAGDTIAPTAVGPEPRGMATGLAAVWVANSGGGSVSRIGFEASGAETIELPGAAGPHGIAVGDEQLWVSSRENDRVFRLPVDREGATGEPESFPVGANPKGVAIAAGTVWVANTDAGTVSRLDAGDGSARGAPVEVGGTPRDVLAAGGRIWVSKAEGEVVALDPADGSELGTVEVPGSPEELASGAGRIWVTTGNSGPGVVAIEPAS